MTTFLNVINRGLVRLGVPPIASLEDGQAQALVAASMYDEVRDACLANFPWSFALREATLAELVIPDGAERWTAFAHTYQIPGGCVRVIGLESGAPYQLTGDQLHTDDTEATLYYVYRVIESAWPATFAQYVSFFFAGSVALPLTEDADRATLMFNEAERARKTARAIDSQQVPPRVFNLMQIYARRGTNPLVGA